MKVTGLLEEMCRGFCDEEEEEEEEDDDDKDRRRLCVVMLLHMSSPSVTPESGRAQLITDTHLLPIGTELSVLSKSMYDMIVCVCVVYT